MGVEHKVLKTITTQKYVDKNIDNEATLRESGDVILQSNIDAEKIARESGDTILQANITAEATTRETVDNTKQDKLIVGSYIAISEENVISTTYKSETAVSEGTDVSLVTTGEKYTWNNKADTDGTYSSMTVGNAVNLSSLGTKNSGWTWGTLTTGNGYTQLYGVDEPNGGSMGVAAKSGKICVQIDGDYYGNEGNSRVAYTSDLGTQVTYSLSGTTLTITTK